MCYSGVLFVACRPMPHTDNVVSYSSTKRPIINYGGGGGGWGHRRKMFLLVNTLQLEYIYNRPQPQ